MNSVKPAKGSKSLPTVQERIEKVASELVELKPSLTTEMIEDAARKADMKTRTAKEYLKGNVAFLHRGEKLLKTAKKVVAAA